MTNSKLIATAVKQATKALEEIGQGLEGEKALKDGFNDEVKRALKKKTMIAPEKIEVWSAAIESNRHSAKKARRHLKDCIVVLQLLSQSTED